MPAKALSTSRQYAHRAQTAAATVRKQGITLKCKGKTKRAVEAMVFDALPRKAAADKVGMSDVTLRTALTKPHVAAYLNECMEVLRSGARPQALNQIVDLSQKAESDRVKLDASKYLDGMDRTVHQQGAQVNVGVQVNVETPGYVIDLTEHPPEPSANAKQIEHLASHDGNALPYQPDVPDDE